MPTILTYLMNTRISLKNQFHSHITHPWNVVYIARKANRNYVHSIEEVCQRFAGNIISVQQVPGVFAKIMGEHGILARRNHGTITRDYPICPAKTRLKGTT